jgi:hypothetical protein
VRCGQQFGELGKEVLGAGRSEQVQQSRRFLCGNGACSKATFAEQVPGLTTRYGRRTCGLQMVLQVVALALGGRAGARLSGRLACPVSRSTLLRLIRAAPDPGSGTPLVLGADDFALRKGHVYGTVLVDIDTRRPVDMLPERSAESFRAWLDAHPGVEIICRDRGGCYAEGATEGAPLAIQVADRWHLWHNLAEAVERAVARHRSCLQEPPPQPEPGPPGEEAAPPPEKGLAARTRARHGEVHAALARGLTITEISRTLRLERKTVRRYATAATADQLIGGPACPGRACLARTRPTCASDGTKESTAPSGCTPNCAPAATGGASAPCADSPPSCARTPPSARHHQHRRPRRWPAGSSPRPAYPPMTTEPHSPRSPPAAQNWPPPRDLVREFADMLCHWHGERLEAWAAQAENSPVSELRGFSKGLRKDWAAVTAGLTVLCSSGAVEGHVNRIKDDQKTDTRPG